MTHLRQKMLDELQRRNHSQNTVPTWKDIYLIASQVYVAFFLELFKVVVD